jgi:hypothetical protein
MTSRSRTHLTMGLGLVALVLLLRLIAQLGGGNDAKRAALAGSRQRGLTTAPPRAVVPPGAGVAPAASKLAPNPDDFAQYDPKLHVEVLKDLEQQPLPTLERNPFEYGPSPAEIAARKAANARPTTPPPPPPPPPIPLQALGYSETNGVKQAAILDQDDIFLVREGEEFDKHYRAIKITPSQVTVEDETTHQMGELLIPQ